MYTYVISPVAYTKRGKADRAFEPKTFTSRNAAEEFIADMGSRWIMYPNIEIFRYKGTKWFFHNADLEPIIGYSEYGSYKPRKI